VDGPKSGRQVNSNRENVENNKGGEEALQYLDHPNVVKLYHVESDHDFR
jgi:nicotinamide riboside kinase